MSLEVSSPGLPCLLLGQFQMLPRPPARQGLALFRMFGTESRSNEASSPSRPAELLIQGPKAWLCKRDGTSGLFSCPSLGVTGPLPGLRGPPRACLSSGVWGWGWGGSGREEPKCISGALGNMQTLCLADAEGSPLFPGRVGASSACLCPAVVNPASGVSGE